MGKHLLALLLLFLIVYLSAATESLSIVELASLEETYYVDRKEVMFNNLTCLDKRHPCQNLDQVIDAATWQLSNSSLQFNSFQMIIEIRGQIATTKKPFNFSQFTQNFKLKFTNLGDYYTASGEILHQDSIISEFYLEGFLLVYLNSLNVNNGIKNVILNDCQSLKVALGALKFQTRIEKLTFQDCGLYAISNSQPVENLQISNSIFDTLKLKNIERVQIDDSSIIGKNNQVELTNFKEFTMKNSIWTSNVISNFKQGLQFSVLNSTFNSKLLIITMKEVLFDNISINQTQNDNHFYQLIDVESVSILNSLFFHNIMKNSAYLISVQLVPSLIIENSIYSLNGGGFLLFTDSPQNQLTTIHISNCEFHENTLAGDSLLKFSGGKILTLKNTVFRNNNGASFGSCIQNERGDVEVTDCSFDSNSATRGGSIYTQESIVSFKNSTFSNNRADSGAAIYYLNNDSVKVMSIDRGTYCVDNIANYAGGCIFSTGIIFKVSNLNCFNNTALSYGNDIAFPLETMLVKDDIGNEIDELEVFSGESIVLEINAFDSNNNSAKFLKELIINYDENDLAITHNVLQKENSFSLIMQIYPKTENTHFNISIDSSHSMSKTLSVTILPCPYSYELRVSENNGFYCFYIPLDIIIPTIIGGIVSLLIIIGSISYATISIIRKLLKLRKQEKAENEIEKKFKDKDFIFESDESSSLLQRNSVNNHQENERKQYVIPISEINIVKKIAEGGNGIVYLAQWNRTNVAIKRLKNQTEDLEEFEKESILMSSLRHPCIVSCFGVCITSTFNYIVVEFMENGSLERAIYNSSQNRDILRFSSKLSILIDISKGMTYLHSIKPHKVIHRDLKSANVLLDNNLRAKVCDFGLSKVVSGTSTMTCNVGTLFYCCPEMLSEKFQGESTKMDVYSFSIVMWELLFEMAPYSNELNDSNSFSILLKVRKGHRPTLLYDKSFELVTDEWISHNFTKKQIETLLLPKVKTLLTKYCELMQSCWSHEPENRPNFLQITDILEELYQNFI